MLFRDYYRNLVEDMYDGVYFIDKDKLITYWNKAAERITGFPFETVNGRHISEKILRHADAEGKSLSEDLCPVVRTLEDGIARDHEIYIYHKEGHRIPVYVRCSPIRDANGNITGAVELFSDRTSQEMIKKRLKELEKLAYLDELTQLANRRYLEMTIVKYLDELRRYHWNFGLLLLDIDNFKNINDKYGHNVGDDVLEMLGHTFSSSARSSDLFGRWGGEEFIALIRNVDRDLLFTIADRHRKFVELSYLDKNREIISVTVSVGATLGRPDDTTETIVNRADKLLYKSKDSGKNCTNIDDENTG